MIQLTGITKYYGDFCAVEDLDLTIPQGQILGLLGPNGAGKTTTLRMITGYLAATRGDITVKEMNVAENNLAVKKIIGYLPESAPLYQDMLVYDYLDYVAELHDIMDSDKRLKRLKELTETCGLNEVMHRPIGELSKGYKQRVGLAHAMMGDPEILILDEPTSGLDPNQIVEIRELIKKLGREKTVVVSSHILSEVEATCDRVVIINRGKIVADGSPDELKRGSGDDYRIHVSVETDAPFDDIVSHLKGVDGVLDIVAADGASAGQTTFQVVCGTDVRSAVSGAISAKGWILNEFRLESKTLENIFTELTKGE